MGLLVMPRNGYAAAARVRPARRGPLQRRRAGLLLGPQSWAAGQADAIAILMRRTLTRTSAHRSSDIFTVHGYSAAQTMVAVLKQCGDELTRDNVKQPANIHDLKLPMLLPGITVSTSVTILPGSSRAIDEVRRHHLEVIWRM
jgi:hypothetical protein